MRFQFLALCLMVLAAAGTFWYRSTETICPVPLAYHLGSIAPQFNLSREKAETYLAAAEMVWEKESDHNLFYYTASKGIEVNFIFDERQELADSQTDQKATLDRRKAENQAINQTIDSLRNDFDNKQKDYQARSSAYETKLNAYNAKVNSYNDQGGAPNDVFKKLESEKNALNKESNTINSMANTLNEIGQKINELSQKNSLLIDSYNVSVKTYNNEFGFSREFTQGDYQNKVINIYKFSTDKEVKTVLAHEFGHSLGLDHVDGTSSIMYYLVGDTTTGPVLSTQDKTALVTLCGTGKEFSHRLRTVIRSLLISISNN